MDRTNAERQARFRARQRGEDLWSETMNAMLERDLVAERETRHRQDVIVHVSRRMMLAHGHLGNALDSAEKERAHPDIIQFLKSAVDAGSTLSSYWGNQLV